MTFGGLSHAVSDIPLLSFSSVCRRHREAGREIVVLDSVSFELHAGGSLGIYGERRSGKSTLMRLAAGLEVADEGNVCIEGRQVACMSTGERVRLLRGVVALLTPDGWLPTAGETVMDHVAMSVGSAGLSLRESRRRALEALDRVAIAGTSAQEMTVSLSAVERARVILARALVREPRLLIVDEPAPLPSLLERERLCALLRSVAHERGIALLVASEELGALQGIAVLASLSGGELCTTQQSASVVELPRRRAGGVERP